jgi:hypothetical protein
MGSCYFVVVASCTVVTMARYTAEPRDTEFEGEWCIVDEDIGPIGSCIKSCLTREEAIRIAAEMNEVDDG